MKIDKYKNRSFVILSIIISVVLIFIVRLAFLQLVDDEYKISADNNAFLRRTIYPSRGLIYDRNGKLLVYNRPSYDVLLVMKEMENFDTIAFCQILNITKENFKTRVKNIKDRRQNRGYSPFVPQIFLTQLSDKEHGVLQEKLFKFPGVYIQSRALREYAFPVAANVFGYVSEVSKGDLEKDDYYVQGDYIGKSGVENSYEGLLRGVKGCEMMLRDSRGKIVGRYESGLFDEAAQKGRDMTLSLDIDLQIYGEELMKSKLGGIVAIEPKTGEILAAVSAPSFSRGLRVGRAGAAIFETLKNDPLKPLLNRSIMGRYAPGSTFKTTNALIFQQEGIISTESRFGCHYGYTVGNFHLGCHGHYSPLNLPESLQHSCNAYYCAAFRALLDNKKYGDIAQAFEVWKNHVVTFGFGYKLGIDVPNENRGYIPNRFVYDKIHGENRWKSLNIVSLSIGQGEVTATPLQIANLVSIIANRGNWVVPHFFKSVAPADTVISFERKNVGVEERYFEPVIEGMKMAVNAPFGGTAGIARIDSLIVCGKTGTAQNPHGQDHSVFMGFAPMDDPQIAIAVLVENAGFGATWAAPIASLMIEKYLKGEVPKNRKWLEERLLNAVILPYDKKKK